MAEQVAANFVSWFLSQNGTLDTEKVGIVDFPGHGRGAVALQDIPVRHLVHIQSSAPYVSIDIGGLYAVYYPSRLDAFDENIFTPKLNGQIMEGAWITRRLGRTYSLHDVGRVKGV